MRARLRIQSVRRLLERLLLDARFVPIVQRAPAVRGMVPRTIATQVIVCQSFVSSTQFRKAEIWVKDAPGTLTAIHSTHGAFTHTMAFARVARLARIGVAIPFSPEPEYVRSLSIQT